MYEKLVEALRLCAKYGKAEDALANAEQAADAIEAVSRHAAEWEFLADSWQKACKRLESRMPRWIPVTERLPEPFETVFVCYQREGRYGTSCGHYYIDRGTIIWKASGIIPTHWQPLPEPPKEETE